MSSVVNKSKNKFAPKAKVRARTATLAAEPAPTSTNVSVVVSVLPKPTESPAPAPTPEATPAPFEDRNAGIPMLEGATAFRPRVTAPPKLVDDTVSLPAKAPTPPPVIDLEPTVTRVAVTETPQLVDTVAAATAESSSQVGSTNKAKGKEKVPAAPKGKRERKGKGKGKAKGTDAEVGTEITEDGTEAAAKKARTRTPASRKRKAVLSPSPTPATEGETGPSTEGARRSSRAKRQRVQVNTGEDAEGEEDELMEDLEEEGEEEGDAFEQGDEEKLDEGETEYEGEENQHPKKTKGKPKTKAAAKEKAPPKEKAPQKPRAPKKPKEPGELGPRRRGFSPVDSESRTIEEGIIKMKELCHDMHQGKKSKRYKELESTDWVELVRRQRAYKAELAERRARGEIVDETDEQRLERLAQANLSVRPAVAPQMRIVDGRLVLDEESLRVDRHQRDALEEDDMEIVEENVHTRLVNSSTWSKRDRGDRWEGEDTERFFGALSMFGTDFEMISRMFPGRTRRHIKNKFNCEERKDPKRITQALKSRVVVDMTEYSQVSNLQFPDPALLGEELQRLRDQHEQEAEAQKEQAVAMEQERQDLANQAMRDSENGVVHQHQPGKKKKKGKDNSRAGEVVLSMSIEEYERERLRRLEEEE